MGKIKYHNPKAFTYKSLRYGKQKTVPEGYGSDGSSGGVDIWSQSWWVHDILCEDGTWDDGTPCSNWQASTVLSDILKSEGRWFRARTWWVGTFFFRRWKMKLQNLFCIIFMLTLFGCGGCSLTQKVAIELDKIPNCSGDIQYDRNGVWSSAHVTGEGFKKTDESVTAEELSIKANYGPASISLVIKNYVRDRNED